MAGKLLALLAAAALAACASNPPPANPATAGANAASQDEVIALLVAGNFDEADRRVMDVQRGFEAGRLTEFDLLNNYRRFHTQLSPEAVAKLDEWVARSPGSYAAHLARGQQLKYQGLSLRGVKYVQQTSPEAVAEAKEYFSRADAELQESLPLTPKPYFSYYELLGLAMERGQHDKAAGYLAEADRLAPDNSLARDRYMVTLTPRWGGSYEAEDAFVRQCAEEGVPDSVIAQLKAIDLNDQGITLLERKDPQGAKARFTAALQVSANAGHDFHETWTYAAYKHVCAPPVADDYCR